MATSLRVLILEDRSADAELMLHALRRAGYELDWRRVETELDYVAHLEPTLDVILADYNLPQFDALRALQLLQERNLDIPFIVVTGTVGEEAAVECIKQGAADYLLKDRLARLESAVAHALEQKRLRDVQRQAEEALRRSLEETARRQRLLLFLSQAAHAVQRARTPAEVYQTIGDEVAKLGYHATLFTVTEDQMHLALAHMTFKPALLQAAEKLTGLSARDYRFRLEPRGFYQRIVAEGNAVFSNPGSGPIAEALPRLVRPLAGRLATILGVEKAIYAPLIVGGRAHSLLTVMGADLGEADVPAVTVFASQVAIALESARLYQAAQQEIAERKRAEQVQVTLYRISEAAQATQDLDELYHSIHAIIGELMPARNFYIALYDASADLFYFPYHADEWEDVWLPMQSGKSLTGYVLRTGKPLLATRQVFDQLVESDQIELIGAPSVDWLGVPLKTAHGMIGVMAVQTYTEAARLNEDDKDVLVFVSTQVAMAIDRKRAEAALRASEEKFRTFIEQASEGFVLLDEQGNVIEWNQAQEKIWGVKRDEVEGKPFWEAQFRVTLPERRSPDRYEYYRTILLDALRTGQSPIFNRFLEVAVCRPHGERRFIQQAIFPIKTDQGCRIGSITRDITESKQAEAALKQSEEQFRRRAAELQSLYETSLRLNSQLEMADLLRFIVEQAVELLGAETGGLYMYDPRNDSLIMTVAVGHWTKYIGDSLKRGEGLAGRAFQSRQPLAEDRYNAWPGRVTRYDDEGHWDAILAAPLLSDQSVLGVLDMGGKHAFDEDHLRLASLFAAQATVAIENAHLHAEVLRRARGLAALNQAGQIMASTLDLDTLLGRIMEQVQSLLEAQAVSVMLGALTPDKTGEELVFAAATSPGSKNLIGTRLPITAGIAGWVMRQRQSALVADARTDPRFFGDIDRVTGMTTRSVLAVPLIVKGSALGVIEAIDKATGAFDQHDLEVLEALSNSAAIAIENARLYATEHERAAALAGTLERQRELDRLQREFIQNVSHELRTPLALIRGHAEVLESGWMGELSSEQKQSVGVIVRRAQLLAKLVNDIVNILEIDRRKLVREPTDLAWVVRASLADLQAVAEQAEIVLSAEITPDLPPISGDAIALRRMVDNLVGNAIKFTPAGERVTVRLAQRENGMTLEVADTGIGIPSEHQERIFERFYQINGSATRKYGGMGLGLALVKEIAEAHGGQVSVTSQVGVGTTFAVSLPTV